MKKSISLILSLVLCLSLLTGIVSAAENPFTDVKEGKFYYDAVLWAVQKEITTGTTATTFSPDNTCTRGQVVTFLWRAFGSPEPTKTTHPFTDVKETAFYYKAMLWAVENGVTSGMTATTFEPSGNCTRGQVVTFLHRAAGKVAPTKTEHPFTDVKETAFYYQAMLWAVENGITSGMTPTTFVPGGNCTRGQVVTFLYRTLKDGIPEEKPTDPTEPSEKPTDPTEKPTEPTEPKPTECSHKYDNACDAQCNVCGENRTPAAHVYDNACDKDCNVCGATRTPASHVYDNACDASCNVCGNTRTPAAHIYSDDLDTDCNVCGAARYVPMKITLQPTDVLAIYGETVTYTVAVVGGKEPYSYQWQIHTGSDYFDLEDTATWATGQKTDTLSFHAEADDFNIPCLYRCVITDATGKTVISDSAKVIEIPAPLTIITQPENPEGAPGDTVYLLAQAQGGIAPLSYRWEYSLDGSSFMPAQLGTYFKNFDTDTLSFTLEATDFTLYHSWRYRCVITDAAGNKVISDVVELVEKIPPLTITAHPTDVSAMIGDPVVFTAVAEGGKGSYTYQWQYMSNMQPNWLDITDSLGGLVSGYQSADLQVSVISDHYNDCYLFRCIITDSIGNSVTSDAATVTEFVPLTIYTQPMDLYVSEGTDCEFRILVGSGLPTYTYQWYWKMNGISNAIPFDGSEGLNAKGYNTDTLTFSVSQDMIDNETFVFCTVTDQTGTEVTSQRAYLVPPYGCYQHSASHGAEVGEVVDISVYICGGKAPYTYQWQRRFGDNGTFKNYGAAVVSYELEHTLKEEMTPEILDMLPQYQCIITDANGYVAKNSKPICIWEYKELTITSQPKNAKNVSVGDTVTFTVEATSSDLPIQYQWYSRQVNGYALFEAIEGATDASYTHTFTEADRKYNVEFYCSVWDFNGHGVVSDRVTPTYKLWIKSQSKTEWNLLAGDQQTFVITPAGGSGKYTYSWEICDTTSGSWHSAAGYSWIDSASAKTFALKITPKSKDYSKYEFRCKVSDGVHTITSETIRINVREFEALSIAAQPQNAAGDVGDTVSFTVTAAGSEKPFTYQWMYKDNTQSVYSKIPGATSATYTRTLSEDDKTKEAVFYCIVSDATGDRIFTQDVHPLFPLWIKSQSKTEWDLTVNDQPVFSVEAAGGSGTYTYEWEIYFDQNRKWSTIADKYSWIDETTTNTPSMKIIRLRDWYECYSFRCKIIDAENPENYIYSEVIRIDVGY